LQRLVRFLTYFILFFSSQKSVASFLQAKYSPYDARQLDFDNKIMKFIAKEGLSFNLVGTDGFKELMEDLAPRCTVKHPTTFSRNKLPLLYASVKKQINADIEKSLQDCKTASITTDMWSSAAQGNKSFYIFILIVLYFCSIL